MDELSERQLEIIRATIALISDEGVQNFSIRKLARRVGVTEPAIYRHFENKDDLMMKLATYIVRNWHQLIGEFPLRTLPLREKVHLLFTEVVRYMQENRSFVKTLVSADLFAHESGMTEILLQLRSEGLMLFSGLLASAQESEELRREIDALTVAKIFFGTVWWLVTDWLSNLAEKELLDAWEEIWPSLALLIEPAG